MKEQIENLIEAYTKQMEYLKNFPSYADTTIIQTVSVLRNVIDDLKMIINNAKACKDCRYFVRNNQPTKDGYCNHDNVGTYDVDSDEEIRLDVNDDFCCNKWEQI